MTKISNFPYLMSFSKEFTETINVARNLQATTGREVCGVVGGRMGQIFECTFVENVSQDPSAFLMDPVQMSKAIDELGTKGYDLIALFHTHPGGPSAPSGTDLEQRSIDVPMLIITPTEIKAWRFKDAKTFDEVRIAIHDPVPKVSLGPIKELRTDGLRFTVEVSGKVFEELPGILKSFFSNRNGNNWEDRMRDVTNIIQLVQMNQRGVREGEDPDGNLSELLRNPRRNQPETGISLSSTVSSNTPFGGTTTFTGLLPDPPRPKPEPERPAPHTHRYKKVSKDGEGRNIYECTFEKCDKSLTIDGEIDEVVVEGKINVVAAQFKAVGDEEHGELAKGQDTAGKGADSEAGQEAGRPGGAG